MKPDTMQPTIKEMLRVDQTRTNPINCDNMKPDCDKNKRERHCETKPSKPRKPKTKVVHTSDIRLFLDNKKKERELKQENSRGKTFILPTICDKNNETSDSTCLSQQEKFGPLLNITTIPGDKTLFTKPEGKHIANLMGEFLCGDL